MTSAEIDAMFKQISSWPNEIGYMLIAKSGGIAIRSNLPKPDSSIYSAEIPVIVEKALKIIQQIILTKDKENTDDELEFVRLKTTHHEVLISTSSNYMLLLLQNPISGEFKRQIKGRDDVAGAEY